MPACDFCGKDRQGGSYYVGRGGVRRFACHDDSERGTAEFRARRAEELVEREQANLCTFVLGHQGYCKNRGYPHCPPHSQPLTRFRVVASAEPPE
jgi:hypothetical protein